MAAVVVVLLGLYVSVAAAEAAGVTHLAAAILRIAAGDGTLVVEVDDPQVKITIDGENLIITGAGPQEVRRKPGQYEVQATKGGQVVKQEPVTIERGGWRVLKVALEQPVTPPVKESLASRPYSLWSKPAVAQRLDELSKSLQSNPRDADLFELRADVYAHLGRYDEAARDFAAALAIPDYRVQRRIVDSVIRDDQVFPRVAALLPKENWLRIERGQLFGRRG